MSPFPLFRLPFVPLCEVFHHFSLAEIVRLSLGSDRSRKNTRFVLGPTKSFKTSIAIKPFSSVSIKRETERFSVYVSEFPEENLDTVRIEGSVVPCKAEGHQNFITTYWKVGNDGIKEVTEHFCKLFNSKIHGLTVETESKSDDPKWVVDWIMSKQESLEICFFDGKHMKISLIRYFLDRCKVREGLGFCLKTCKKFSHDWPLDMKILFVDHGHWLKIHNLLALNCEFTFIGNSKYTCKNLNMFLKNWLNGGGPKIKYLRIQVKRFNLAAITKGIDGQPFPPQTARKWTGFKNTIHTFHGGFDIKRSDGIVGTVKRLVQTVNNVEEVGFIFLVGPLGEA
uniref:FBA_2 domain-containing protein n=1 Tax=Caenorhabditis tropicalis TaxID=1561998 RepID=A0A1I7V4E5_9PELO